MFLTSPHICFYNRPLLGYGFLLLLLLLWSSRHPFTPSLARSLLSSRRSSRRDPPTSGSDLKWKQDEWRRRRGEADAAAGREPAPPAAVLVGPLLPRRRKRWWWQQVAPAGRSSVFSAGNRILAGLPRSGGDGMGSCFWRPNIFLVV